MGRVFTLYCFARSRRHVEVVKHFPSAMGVDDFIARLEMALAAYGFTGDNAIGEFPRCYCRSSAHLQPAISGLDQAGRGTSILHSVQATLWQPRHSLPPLAD